jgi:hypothetical protein
LISGGTDHFGRPVTPDEIYDPITKRFKFATPGEDAAGSGDSSPVYISASIPEDGTANVPILPLISVRFSQLLDVRTASATNFVLTGPNDKPVPAKVSAAEAGRLVFLMSDSALAPGTHYILNIRAFPVPCNEALHALQTSR